MSARNPYWKARLERWQLWYFKSPGGLKPMEYRDRVDFAIVQGTLTPAINDEALVTDQLVARLDRVLKRTVKAYYLDRGGRSVALVAVHLGVSDRTLHNRMCQAEARLEELLADRQRQAEQRAVEGRAA